MQNDQDVGFRHPHRDYRYLCHVGWRYEWYHCPRCRAQNHGWIRSNGEPIYSGGIVEVEGPNDRDGTLYVSMAACDCWVGDYEAARLGIRRFDRLPPAFRTIVNPLRIAWDKQETSRPPVDLPSVPSLAQLEELDQRIGRQTARYYARELTLLQLVANIQHLIDRTRPPTPEMLTAADLPQSPTREFGDEQRRAPAQQELAGIGY